MTAICILCTVPSFSSSTSSAFVGCKAYNAFERVAAFKTFYWLLAPTTLQVRDRGASTLKAICLHKSPSTFLILVILVSCNSVSKPSVLLHWPQYSKFFSVQYCYYSDESSLLALAFGDRILLKVHHRTPIRKAKHGIHVQQRGNS